MASRPHYKELYLEAREKQLEAEADYNEALAETIKLELSNGLLKEDLHKVRSANSINSRLVFQLNQKGSQFVEALEFFLETFSKTDGSWTQFTAVSQDDMVGLLRSMDSFKETISLARKDKASGY